MAGKHVQRFLDIPDNIYVYAFPQWKHKFVRQCFYGKGIIFLKRSDKLPERDWLIIWGMEKVPSGLSQAVTVLRMEDGFLRSVGLGADLVRPLSWVLDGQGIYYDSTCQSDLEQILEYHNFDNNMQTRAARLRECIIESGITKYNVGYKIWQRPENQPHVILVIGQVESDASIAFGAPKKMTNLELLQTVNLQNPGAYIIYKPHPDVIAGMRLGGKKENEAANYCNEIVLDVVMGELLNKVNEVHVLTSLAGFEALLRGVAVTCYGQPFYAGWGLTNDIIPNTRRTRKLTLDELVYGVLIEYPLYLNPDGKDLTTPEQALDSLLKWRDKRKGKEYWWRGIARIFIRYFAGVR